MTVIIAKWADDNLKKYAKEIEWLSSRFPELLPREINKVGARAKTQLVRNLTKQTGLPRRTIVKAVGHPEKAKPSRLLYEMRTKGGEIRLKFFSPRETRKGVSAKPFGKRKVFPGTFMKGGRFPNRVEVPAFHGHVMKNLGRGIRWDGTSGSRLTFVRSGVFIPHEMVKGGSVAGFEKLAVPLLQQRVEALIKRKMK